MLLPDVNVLLAGFRSDHVHHRPARELLESARSSRRPLALSDVALAAVIRLSTNGRVFAQPDTADAVLEYVETLLDGPAHLLHASATHWRRFTDLCRELHLRGNIVPDAYLAALALEHGAELVTFDRGFGRFPRLRWRSPLDR